MSVPIYHLRVTGDSENLQTTFNRSDLISWRACLSRPWTYEIVQERVSKLAGQKITVPGDLIGFQWARSKMGTKTVKRTVHHLQMGGDGKVYGQIEVEGRTVLVRCDRDLVLQQRARWDSEAEWGSVVELRDW